MAVKVRLLCISKVICITLSNIQNMWASGAPESLKRRLPL